MPLGGQLRFLARGRLTSGRPWPPRPCQLCGRRPALLVRASAEGSPAEEGPREISLTRRIPGAGYTFMVAGVLKIMTMGWVATGAPRECVRTVAGQYGQVFLIPVGLALALIAKKIVDAGLYESGRFMSFVLGITAFLYFGLYSVLYRYEPRTFYAQQRVQAAAAHSRSPYAEDGAGGGGSGVNHRSNKFIIQRQLEGEYDTRTSAYYSRAPEMQMEEVEARMSGLPAGIVGSGGGGNGAAPSPGVGPSIAERQSGLSSMHWRSQQRQREQRQQEQRRRAAVPSMYESSSRIPGLDDSEF